VAEMWRERGRLQVWDPSVRRGLRGEDEGWNWDGMKKEEW
jgi:hypothetical protein